MCTGYRKSIPNSRIHVSTARCSREDTDKNDGLHVANVLAAATGFLALSAKEHGIDTDCRLHVGRPGDTASLAPGDRELNAVGQGIACVCEDTVRLARAHCAQRDTKPIPRPSGLLTEPLRQGKVLIVEKLPHCLLHVGILRLATIENDIDAAQSRGTFRRDTLI